MTALTYCRNIIKAFFTKTVLKKDEALIENGDNWWALVEKVDQCETVETVGNTVECFGIDGGWWTLFHIEGHF